MTSKNFNEILNIISKVKAKEYDSDYEDDECSSIMDIIGENFAGFLFIFLKFHEEQLTIINQLMAYLDENIGFHLSQLIMNLP